MIVEIVMVVVAVVIIIVITVTAAMQITAVFEAKPMVIDDMFCCIVIMTDLNNEMISLIPIYFLRFLHELTISSAPTTIAIIKLCH